MPKIPLYGRQVQLGVGQLGQRADSSTFEAPFTAVADFAKSAGDVAYRFIEAERDKQYKDKDAELSERVMRHMNEIENSRDYTTASDAKTAADLFRSNMFNEIDALQMTSKRKRELKLSVGKSVSLMSLQAEQKAHNRGLQESGLNTNTLIESKLELVNKLAPNDPRLEMVRSEINKYRSDARAGGYLAYLAPQYQTEQATTDSIVDRLVTGITADDKVTAERIDSTILSLNASFKKGDVSPSVYKASVNLLNAKKSAIKTLADAADSEELRVAQIARDDILFNNPTYSALVTLRENIENSEGKFSKVAKEDRPALLAAVNAQINLRKTAEINTLEQRVEVATDTIVRTGEVPAGVSEAITKIMEMDPVRGNKIGRAVKSARTASKYVGGIELASTEVWNENLASLKEKMDTARAQANTPGSTDAQVDEAAALIDAYKFAQKAAADRASAIKSKPREYYNNEIQKLTGVSGKGEGAGYVNWARSTGLIREDEISVFTKDEAEALMERMKDASPVGMLAIFNEEKERMPGVSSRILIQSFKKAGMDTTDNLIMVLADKPIAGDLRSAMLMDDKDLKNMIADIDVEKNIVAAVTKEMMDFNRSILGSTMEVDSFVSRAAMGAEGSFGGRASFVNDTNKAVLKLAKYYVATQGMSPADAAKKAGQVHRSQFHYSEINGQVLRVPSSSYTQGDTDKIAAGLSEALNNLMVQQVQQQAGATDAQKKIYTNLFVQKLRMTGSWISTPDSRGAYMIDEFGVPVLNPEGKRISIQFKDIFLGAGLSVSDVGGPAA
ncbi:MAG: hypothetical protein VW496_01635 [Pelagibacteraceae bacterium]